jgi:hypothetical protein
MDFFNLFKPQGLTPFQIKDSSASLFTEKERKRKEEEERKRKELLLKQSQQVPIPVPTPVQKPDNVPLTTTIKNIPSTIKKVVESPIPQAVIKPIIDTLKLSAAMEARNRLPLYKAIPFLNKVGEQQEQGVKQIIANDPSLFANPQSEGPVLPSVKGVAQNIRTLGTLKGPLGVAISGGLMIPFKGVENILQGKKFGDQDYQKTIAEGVEFGQLLGPLSEGAGLILRPFISKINPQEIKTIFDVVKRLTSKAITGGTGGGAYGAFEPAEDLEERVKNITDNAIMFALFDMGIESTTLAGKGIFNHIKEFIAMVKKMPPADRKKFLQAGFIGFGEDKPESMESLNELFKKRDEKKIGSTILSPEEIAAKYPKEKFGIKLKVSDIHTIINEQPINPKTLQKAVQYMDKLTSAHDPSISVPALNYAQRMIGDKKLDKLVDTYLGQNLFRSGTNVRDFWDQVNKELAVKKKPSVAYYLQQEKEYVDFLATQKPPIENDLLNRAKVIVENGGTSNKFGDFNEVVIKKVPENQIRNKGIGDYKLTKNGGIEILVSDKLNEIEAKKTAIHELVESVLAKKKNISFESINEFDKKNIKAVEPGELPNAPYHQEHIIANKAENIISSDINKIKIDITKPPEHIINRTPDPKLSVDADTQVKFTQSAKEVIKKDLDSVVSYMNQHNLDPVTVGKVWDKEVKAPNEFYTEAVNQLKKVYDQVWDVRRVKGKVGFTPKMPHVFPQEVDELSQFFTEHTNSSPILDTLMQDPHRLLRTDKGKGYLENPVEAVLESGTRAFQDYYRPLTKNQKTIIDHVGKLEDNKAIDYVNLLAEEPPLKTVNAELKALLPALSLDTPSIKPKTWKITGGWSPIRQRYLVFEKIGGEIADRYKKVVESIDFIPKIKKDLEKFIKANDSESVLKYFIKELEPKNLDQFISGSRKYISQRGLEPYTWKVFDLQRKRSLQELMDTVKKYNFADPKVKRVVNQFIDDNLKAEKAKRNLFDTFFNTANRMFSLAQIAGNIKVAAVQVLDLFRLPANYSSRDALSGFANAFKRARSIERQYGLEKSTLVYKQQSPMGKMFEVSMKLPETLYGPIKATESFKNRVFLGAAESKGKRMGLEGKALTRYVRDEMFKRANIAHTENTPLFLKDSALNRSLAQYSQFALKNLVEFTDAVAEKEGIKAVKLALANITGALTVAVALGYPLKYAFQGILPVGLGPLWTIPFELVQQIQEMNENKELGRSIAYNQQRIKQLLQSSLVPAGVQYGKTKGMIDVMKKGYADTASGLVKYPAPEDSLSIWKGLLFGKSTIKLEREYDKSKGTPLGKNQSTLFKSLSRKERKKYFDAVMKKRKKDREETLKKESGKLFDKAAFEKRFGSTNYKERLGF